MSKDYVIVKLLKESKQYPNMQVGREYVVPRNWLIGQLDINSCRLVADNIADIYNPIDLKALKQHKSARVLMLRTYGLGDQLWLSACARYLWDNFRKNISQLTMSCLPEFKTAVDYVPHVSYMEAPIAVEDWCKYDFHVCFSGLIDGSKYNDRNVYEVYLEAMGAENPDMSKYGRPWLRWPQGACIPNPFVGKPTVILQAVCAGAIRDLPVATTVALIQGLELRGYQVIIPIDIREERALHAVALLRKQVPGYGSVYFFSPDITPGKDPRLETFLPYLQHADWIIGTDSSLCHFAEGLGLPAVTMFGPFGADTRVKHYRSVIALDKNPSCRCARHSESTCPKGFVPAPCMRFDPQMVLTAIDGSKGLLSKGPTGEESTLIML